MPKIDEESKEESKEETKMVKQSSRRPKTEKNVWFNSKNFNPEGGQVEIND